MQDGCRGNCGWVQDTESCQSFRVVCGYGIIRDRLCCAIGKLEMTHFLRTLILAVCFCSSAASAQTGARILAMGVLFFLPIYYRKNLFQRSLHGNSKSPQKNRSVSGARIICKLPISGSLGFKIGKQCRQGPWTGLSLTVEGMICGSAAGAGVVNAKMNQLISQDRTRGAIPDVVAKLRATKARIVYVEYLRSQSAWSPIEH